MVLWSALAYAAPLANPPVAPAPAPVSPVSPSRAETPAGPAGNPAIPTAPPTPPPAVAAATLSVDAKVPVEILLEGLKLGELYFPGVVRWDVAPGPHVVRIYTSGNPTDVPVTLASARETRILVGRNGITSETLAPAMTATGPANVEFRLAGGGAVQLRLDKQAHALEPGRNVIVSVPSGNHPLSVRSSDGTVIWASGDLQVGAGPVVVVIAEGRLPEVSGPGAFHAGGG